MNVHSSGGRSQPRLLGLDDGRRHAAHLLALVMAAPHASDASLEVVVDAPLRGVHRRAQRDREGRVAHALLGDDARDVLGGRHVERRVEHGAALGRDDRVANLGDLLRPALLDRDVLTRQRRKVDGAGRHDREEGDPVLARAHRQLVRTDLVGRVSVGSDAVRANEHDVHLALLHEQPSRVVGDEVDWHTVAHELPRGQARALQPRPRLVHPHVHALAGVVALVDHADRRADVDRRQRARVAVVQDVRAARHKGRTVLRHALVHADVELREVVRLHHHLILHLGHTEVAAGGHLGDELHDVARRPRQVHRGGPRRVQDVLGGAQLLQKRLAGRRVAL
mmetsp:Transcript_19122/g.67540  ORF Transcript_19122/g.67540 Transcript_19122/m.67540 type:complete len:337 (-) Transcript_19122:248-1258(-)